MHYVEIINANISSIIWAHVPRKFVDEVQSAIYLSYYFSVSEHISSATKNDAKCHMWLFEEAWWVRECLMCEGKKVYFEKQKTKKSQIGNFDLVLDKTEGKPQTEANWGQSG